MTSETAAAPKGHVDSEAAPERLRSSLHSYVALLVTQPDVLSVDIACDTNNTIVLTITPAAPDRGRVIGAKGATINTIRSLWGKAALTLGFSYCVVDLPEAPVEPGYKR